MKHLLTFLLFMGSVWAMAQSTDYNPYRQFTPDELRQDFDVLQRALTELHPGLYRYNTPDSLAVAYQQTMAKMNQPMSDVAFGLAIRPYIGQVRCAHTSLANSKERQRYLKQLHLPPWPISVLVKDERMFVATRPLQTTGVAAFEEITSLDGLTTPELIAQFRPMVWGDGYTKTAHDGMLSVVLPALYRATYGFSDTLRVGLTDSSGRVRTVSIPIRAMSARRLARNAKADTIRRQKQSLPTRTVLNRRGLQLAVVREDSAVAVLKIERFGDGTMRRSFGTVFDEIKRRHIRQLVIDVRGNLGGSAQTCRDLLRYLTDRPFIFWDSTVANQRNAHVDGAKTWISGPFAYIDLHFRLRRDNNGNLQLPTYRKITRPRKSNHFDGPILILTDGLSFSAASIFPSLARQFNAKVKIVGRETGGGAYGCNAGQSFFVELPNTRMIVKIPAYRIRLPLPGRDTGRGVLPDYPVRYLIDDLRQGRDKDLEQVKSLLQTNDKSGGLVP